MDISDGDVFASKPYTFIVQGKPFYVHAVLVSGCSAPLDRMISGHMSEAQQGFALIEDVTQDAFARFIRWMYGKDYLAAEHTLDTPKAEDDEIVTVTEIADGDDWGGWGMPKKEKKKKKKEIVEVARMKETFINQEYIDDSSDLTRSPAPRSNKAPEEDYTAVFRSHAEIYVFAEKYDVQPLKKLALKKLQQTLAIFTLYSSRVEDVLSLLRYVYAETAPTKQGVEDIRTMLMHYVGTEVGTLEKHGDFKELLAEDHDMLGDFLAMLAQWIG